MRKLVLVLSVPLLAFAVPASAHFNLTMPPSIAKSTEGGKGPAPCGPDTGTTGTPTAVTGGKPLMLNIDETVGHPGFYRFALSLVSPPKFPADNVVKNQAGMVILPTSKDSSYSADFEDPAKFPVLADHLFVHDDGAQSFPSTKHPGQVVIPNLNCDKCTLQVIEFMANHPSNGDSAGYFYHHCALLKITADPSLPIFDPNAGSGGSGGAGGAGGMAGSASAGASGAATAGSTGSAGSSTGGTGGVSGAEIAGAPGVAGSNVGGAVAVAGSVGVAGLSAGGSPAAGGDVPANDAGCSYAPSRHPAKPALALLFALVSLAGLRRRRVRSGRG